MSDPVKIKIPASVAGFIRPGTTVEDRLSAAGGKVELPPRELLLLLFCLSKDREPEVSNAAIASIKALDKDVLTAIEGWEDTHPAILHTFALHHASSSDIWNIIYSHPLVSEATRYLLDSMRVVEEPSADIAADSDKSSEPFDELNEDNDDEEDGMPGEEYFSKYQLAQVMGISEKIKMALTGDKEWRKILIKDPNKLVSSGVLKNPRITDGEVLAILKSGVQNDETMRIICGNREWVKSYQMRKALIENPKTPLANALRYLSTMNDKDISGYAKSRNISSVISTQAKRMVLNKKK